MNGLIGLFNGHFNCNPFKMLPNQFLTSISILLLLEVFSQLATCQLAPGPFKEHPCTGGCQTGHRNRSWGKAERRGVDNEIALATSHQLLSYWLHGGKINRLLDVCVQAKIRSHDMYLCMYVYTYIHKCLLKKVIICMHNNRRIMYTIQWVATVCKAQFLHNINFQPSSICLGLLYFWSCLSFWAIYVLKFCPLSPYYAQLYPIMFCK